MKLSPLKILWILGSHERPTKIPMSAAEASEVAEVAEAPTTPVHTAVTATANPHHVELYRRLVRPASTKRMGLTMLAVAKRLYEHDSTLLASLSERKRYVPGGCGVPNDVRREIIKLHNAAYPGDSVFHNFGENDVRSQYVSPRIRIVAKTKCGRFTYARGWAVCGFK